MKIILYATPVFVFLILLEWIYGLARGRNTYRFADTIASISLGSISRLRGLLFLGFGAWFYTRASDGSPAALVAPALQGAYEVRYFSGANGSVVFRKALEVTAAEVRI